MEKKSLLFSNYDNVARNPRRIKWLILRVEEFKQVVECMIIIKSSFHIAANSLEDTIEKQFVYIHNLNYKLPMTTLIRKVQCLFEKIIQLYKEQSNLSK